MIADPRIAFFDHHAPTWDAHGPAIHQQMARVDSLQPLLGLRPGQDTLEIGCGTGQFTPWLVRAVRPGRVTAIDFSPAMIERAAARGTVADFRVADICADDLGQSRFDIAFCMHAFPHFRDHAAALRAIARALRPAGKLMILHLVGRDRVGAIHHGAGGAVANDVLPPTAAWPGLLAAPGFRITQFVDEPNLFLLVAFLEPSP